MAVFEAIKCRGYELKESLDQLEKVGDVVKFKCADDTECGKFRTAVTRYKDSTSINLQTESQRKGKTLLLYVTRLN
ncbi:MAG: hypothetical protein R3Y50_08820 [Rikenellaceae bacterium]